MQLVNYYVTFYSEVLELYELLIEIIKDLEVLGISLNTEVFATQ